MPKILILLAGQPTSMLDAVADGARSIRFSEVEVRCVDANNPAPDTHGIHQTLTGAEEIVPYDAIVVLASAGGTIDPAMEALLVAATERAPKSAWQNKVGAAFLPEGRDNRPDVWPALRTLGELGMLVVPPDGGGADAARALGARVAQVVSWVTHARSHHHHAH